MLSIRLLCYASLLAFFLGSPLEAHADSQSPEEPPQADQSVATDEPDDDASAQASQDGPDPDESVFEEIVVTG
ncbi:MAG: hypothetical protein AAFY88_15055, partial [Acidobacteriota bacterium]